MRMWASPCCFTTKTSHFGVHCPGPSHFSALFVSWAQLPGFLHCLPKHWETQRAPGYL